MDRSCGTISMAAAFQLPPSFVLGFGPGGSTGKVKYRMRRLTFGLTLILLCGAEPAAAQTAAIQAAPAPERAVQKPAKKPTAKKPPPKPSPIARELFGAATAPAPLAARSIGGYAKGCLAGGFFKPTAAPDWQVFRLPRTRHWGNPRPLGYFGAL